MAFLLYVCVFVTFTSLASAEFKVEKHKNWHLVNEDVCGKSEFADRIIGGQNASIGQYPWMALLGYQNQKDKSAEIELRCGGALINKRYVVTAAHCNLEVDNFKLFTVNLGENYIGQVTCEGDLCTLPPQVIEVEEAINHPDFVGVPENMQNDISLVRLKTPAVYNDFVKPICVPTNTHMKFNYLGKTVEVAGWGVSDMQLRVMTKALQYLSVPVLTADKCSQVFRETKVDAKKQICAGGIENKDSCGGDSGGPLMKVEMVKDGPRYMLLGVVSFGAAQCGSKDVPAMYTRLVPYMKWVLDNMKE